MKNLKIDEYLREKFKIGFYICNLNDKTTQMYKELEKEHDRLRDIIRKLCKQ
jgi:hypothetical protein